MKVILLYITIIIISINCAFSQTRHFFDDISSMKISLCSKGYILSNNNMLMPLKHDWTSQQVFFKVDSSEFVMVRLFDRTNAPTKDRTYSNPFAEKRADRTDKSRYLAKYLAKLGAYSGFLGININVNPTMVGDYTFDSGAVLFAKSGLMSFEIYKKNEYIKRKGKEKDFVKVVSNFIHFTP